MKKKGKGVLLIGRVKKGAGNYLLGKRGPKMGEEAQN